MKRVYEKPEVDFQELFLFDGVANPCWSYKTGEATGTINVYYDTNHNGVPDPDVDELVSSESIGSVVTSGSCDGVRTALSEYIKQWDPAYANFIETKTGTHSKNITVGSIINIVYS